MATYLLSWNPQRWDWHDIEDDIEEVQNNGICKGRWSCGNTKKIKAGNRFFLIKLGQEPRGIIASGMISSNPFPDHHWEDKKSPYLFKTTSYVNIDFDTILNPDNVFPYASLVGGVYDEMHWSPQSSGVTIPDHVAERLEFDWANFVGNSNLGIFPDEADTEIVFNEGSVRTVRVNVYERSKQARNICVNHFGFICSVCDFDFEDKYGEIGQEFIHVHHLIPLSEIGEEYALNPIEDLRPVCPNCHAMLHRRKPAYTIEELKEMINK